MNLQLAEALSLVPIDFICEYKNLDFFGGLITLSFLSKDSTCCCLVSRNIDSKLFEISFNKFRGHPREGGRYYVLHRSASEGPAQVKWNPDGSIQCMEYWEDGKLLMIKDVF